MKKTVDWWSFGCVIYEMIIGSSPFLIPKGKLVSQLMYKQKKNIPSSISKEATDLITKLLVVKPQKRLGYGRKGAKNIKAHPFFKGINWKDAWNKKLTPPFIPTFQSETETSYFDKIYTEEKIDGSKDSDLCSSINTDYAGFTYITGSVGNELIPLDKSGL